MSSATVTIGVSIGLPEPHASRVQRARRSFGDTQAEGIPTHVTLLPPTQVAGPHLAAVEKHLQVVAESHRAFSITLDSTGSFRPVSPVVFLRLQDGELECRRLAQAVRSGPLARPLDHPYHPHVTVAHDVPEDMLNTASEQMAHFHLTFAVKEFQLYRRSSQAQWQVLHSYQLSNGSQGAAASSL